MSRLVWKLDQLSHWVTEKTHRENRFQRWLCDLNERLIWKGC